VEGIFIQEAFQQSLALIGDTIILFFTQDGQTMILAVFLLSGGMRVSISPNLLSVGKLASFENCADLEI